MGLDRLEYMRGMKFFMYPIEFLPKDVQKEIIDNDKSKRTYYLSTDYLKDKCKNLPKTEDKLIIYQENVMKRQSVINMLFPYVREIFLKDDDSREYAICAYELHSANDRNVVLQFCLSNLYSRMAASLANPEVEEVELLFKRNAAKTCKLVDNSRNFHSNRYWDDYLEVNPGFTVLSIALRAEGIDRFGKVGSMECYNEAGLIFRLVNDEYGRLSKMVAQRVGMMRMNGELEENTLFSYDKMYPFITDIEYVADEFKKKLLENGYVKKRFPLYSDDIDEDSDDEEGEVELNMRLLSNDFNPYADQRVSSYYIISWQDGIEEWTCQLSNVVLRWLLDDHDPYELRSKIPTAYKAITNGLKGYVDKGAITETKKVTFFRYEYDASLPKSKKRDIANDCEKTVKDIIDELSDFYKYIKLKNEKEKDKRKQNNIDGFGRILGFQALANIPNMLSF